MPCLYRSLFGFEFIPSVCRCGILTWPQGVWSSWTWYQRVGRKVKANSNPEVTKQDMCPCQLWHFCVLCCHQWWCVLFSFFFICLLSLFVSVISWWSALSSVWFTDFLVLIQSAYTSVADQLTVGRKNKFIQSKNVKMWGVWIVLFFGTVLFCGCNCSILRNCLWMGHG